MITQCVESARKAKAPIVGIPIPGEYPFCIKRQLLVDSLRGLTIIDAAIQLPLDSKQQKMLVIYAAGDRVQSIRKFYPLHSWSPDAVRIPLWNWASEQRDKRGKPKQSGREKKIAQLQKKLAKLGYPKAPTHPLLYVDHWHESAQQYDAKQFQAWEQMTAEGVNMSRPATLGQQYAEYKQQAGQRRWIQAQGRECAAGKITTTQLYTRLRERGLTVKKWSELGKYEKDRCGTLFGYSKQLWEFCGCARKPQYWFKPVDHYNKPGADHYQHWLKHLHEYKELQSMIASLRSLDEAAS